MILSYILCTSLYLTIELYLIPLSPIPSTMASLKPKKLIIDLIRFMLLNFLCFLINIHIRVLIRRDLQFGYSFP